jgi:hypothetical protein
VRKRGIQLSGKPKPCFPDALVNVVIGTAVSIVPLRPVALVGKDQRVRVAKHLAWTATTATSAAFVRIADGGKMSARRILTQDAGMLGSHYTGAYNPDRQINVYPFSEYLKAALRLTEASAY